MTLLVDFHAEQSCLDMELTQGDSQLLVELTQGNSQLLIDFGEIQRIADEEIPVFQGPYEVRPKMETQTLETTGFLMGDDMSIDSIPVAVVSNNSGGTTVIIGG